MQTQANRREAGFLLIALLALLFPLLFILAAMTTVFSGRNSLLQAEVHEEKALIAAESGIDEAIYRASTVTGLVTGTPITRDLGSGMTFTVMPRWLKVDGLDNDVDGLIDEADENIYQLTVTGVYADRTIRRISAYLGPASSSLSFESALAIGNPASTIKIDNKSSITGLDTKMDGTRGDPANDIYGLTVTAPGTIADLNAQLTPAELARVSGKAPAPSLAVATTPIDLTSTILAVQNSANLILTSSKYEHHKLGDGPAGDFKVMYRDGNLEFEAGTQAAGILVVAGDLELEHDVRFDGVIIVLGKVEIEHNVQVFGAIVTGPSSDAIDLEANANVYYSAEAIAGANAQVPGKYTAFNGWQELSRY